MKEVLIQDDEYVIALIEFIGDDFEYAAEFKVYEVMAWEGTDNSVAETELYLSGTIKWDGCSHIYFGDKDGYIHLCGKSYFEKHKEIMDALWDICSKKIINWNEEIAS